MGETHDTYKLHQNRLYYIDHPRVKQKLPPSALVGVVDGEPVPIGRPGLHENVACRKILSERDRLDNPSGMQYSRNLETGDAIGLMKLTEDAYEVVIAASSRNIR